MAPRANTAKARKAPGAAAQDDSESESDGYGAQLQEAAAARARMRKAQVDRDKKRKALSIAFARSIRAIQNRVEKSIMKYKDLHTAMHMRRLKRLQKAVETRDEKLKAIAENLVNMQQVMVNHGTQLAALYKGRRAEVAPLTTETPSQAKS